MCGIREQRLQQRQRRRLRETGELEGLNPEGEEEAIEAKAGPAFVETVEYSGRVIGTKVYENP